MENTVFLGLGSNIGDRITHLQAAITMLREQGLVIAQLSSIYETPPWGFEAETPFYNCVIKASTTLTSAALLTLCKKVEILIGRKPNETSQRYASRSIDIDILLYGDQVVKLNNLIIPHPEMLQRNFVLTPLAEIAADFIHPMEKKTVQQLLHSCPDTATITRREKAQLS